MSSDTVQTFQEAVSSIVETLAPLVDAVRGLITRAQEETPALIPDGQTVDDVQNEVVRHALIALQAGEDVLSRLQAAAAAFGNQPTTADNTTSTSSGTEGDSQSGS